MSLNIEQFSPLQAGSVYVNKPNFDSRVMWYDTNSAQIKYTIIQSRQKRANYTKSWTQEFVVKQIGVLNGYYDGNYLYKFDFRNLIRFQTNTDLVNIQGGGMPEWNYYVNENNVETYIFFDTSNYMFLKYPTWFFENGSGEQSIGQSDLELLISAESGSYFNFDFKNMAENVLPQNRYNISTTIYKNTYFTVSNKYAQDGINLIVKLYNSSNGLLNTFYLNGSPNANVERLIFCEYNCTKVVLQRRIDSETPTTLTTIYPINGCHTLTTNTPNPDIKQLFYSDRNNSLQVFNTTANRFIEEVTTKEYINIGSRKMVNSSTTQRKLHQHTGFNVTEREMYDINKASFVWTVNNDNFVMNEPVMERWMMDNNTFSSYNGTKITEKNVELIMSQERQDTNYSNQKINFYD